MERSVPLLTLSTSARKGIASTSPNLATIVIRGTETHTTLASTLGIPNNSGAPSNQERAPGQSSTSNPHAGTSPTLTNSRDSTPDYSQLDNTPSPEAGSVREMSLLRLADPLEGLALGEHLTAEILGLGEVERSERVGGLKKMSRSELDREDNIARNRKLLDSLELGPGHTSIFEDIGTSATEKAPTAPKGKKNTPSIKPTPIRCSARQQQSNSEVENVIIMEDSGVASESGPSPMSNDARDSDNLTSVSANNETRIIGTTYTFRTFIASLFPEYPDGEGDVVAIEVAWATSAKDLKGVERKWAAANGIAARRNNNSILTCVNRSDWPDWVSKNFEYLTMNDVGSLWSVAVSLWTELERHYGFMSPVSLRR
jgi:hypothetical protein